MAEFHLQPGDALLLVDLQNDFLPGGSLPVPHADQIIGPANQWLERVNRAHLPTYATRDWHPHNHCSFTTHGGPWPPHCIVGSHGADFPETLNFNAKDSFTVINKGTTPEAEAYSGFEGTDLDVRLRNRRIRRLFVAGLATDYCVLNTVLDALRLGYEVTVLTRATRPVELQPGDGERALELMRTAGAKISQA